MIAGWLWVIAQILGDFQVIALNRDTPSLELLSYMVYHLLLTLSFSWVHVSLALPESESAPSEEQSTGSR